MAAIRFFIFAVVVSQFLLLHSVEGEDRNHLQRDCPAFPCGNLSDIRFPYTQSDRPDCGLFLVDGCKNNTPKVQLEQGGRWSPLDSISQANTITIYDEVLAKQLKEDCQSLNNLSFPNLPCVTFKMVSYLNLCKCESALRSSLAKEFSYTVCNNYSIYCTPPEGMQDSNGNDRLLSLCNCPIIQLPRNNPPPKENSQHKNYFSELLTPLVSLKVTVSHACKKCYRKGGSCLASKQGFHCSKGNSTVSVIKVTAASSVGGIVVLIFLVACCIKKFSFGDGRFIWQMKTEEDKKIEAFLKDHEFLTPKRYRYSDMKRITNSFRDKLGKGGYGDVYKGKLPDGRYVAVKILNKSKSNGAEFMNEVASISRTSHVNIITLLGFCFEGCRRALIFEFVPNGSLERFIFEEKANCQLKWAMLYQIAVGIARGLEYLHRGCSTRILHFDIKPHNILLDDEFRPKISDFGLGKLCPEIESAISMTGARGTIGYIAPEVFFKEFWKSFP